MGCLRGVKEEESSDEQFYESCISKFEKYGVE